MTFILFLISLGLVVFNTSAACFLWFEFVDRAVPRFWLRPLLTGGGWAIIVVAVCIALILVMGAFAA